jgi:hypothetical protein
LLLSAAAVALLFVLLGSRSRSGRAAPTLHGKPKTLSRC